MSGLAPEFAHRQARLQAELPSAGIDLVAVAPGTSLRYLLGFSPLADERPCVLLISRDALRFVVPALNAEQVAVRTGLDMLVWTDAEGPMDALRQAAAGLPRGVVAVDNTMRADTLVPLIEVLHPAGLHLATEIIGRLRTRKTPAEIELLQRAAAQADRAMAVGVAACRPGATEAEVAWAIESAFRQDGAEKVEFVIVASGPNSGFPHHDTGSRRLEPGDAVILDIGATLDGYKSDITRVVHLGPPSDEFRQVYAAVLEANRRATAAVRPGVCACEVDRAARGYLESVGLAGYFTHRTGHGLGMDVHEPPYITATSETVLEPGMVFSIEPGVYLPGRFGVRIEDIVMVADDGVRGLTGYDHQLQVKE
jgi:Xaa-Pro aminopeptidase